MNLYNPFKRAEIVRLKMIKDGKYLIARIEGSGQERKAEKVLSEYFRYKDYMDDKEWFLAALDEVWSSKFLGLTENIWKVPIKEVKKLEFQNPAYSAAYRLGGDPRNYSKVFTIQVAGCDFDCNYCYVPKQLNIANPKLGEYFSAKEMIGYFLSAKKESKEPMNVIRISGGNPTIVPEIIVDIYSEIKNQNLNVYFWIDSNLSTSKYLKNLEEDLKNILNKKNVGVVGCFKGVSKEDFSLLTGVELDYYQEQFETAKWFLKQKTDFYVYLPALVYEDDIEKKLTVFMERLRGLNKNLPLRVEVLEIIDYPGANLNIERAKKLGRPMPKTDQRLIFDLWHNKILPKYYSPEDLNKYCCEISLYK